MTLLRLLCLCIVIFAGVVQSVELPVTDASPDRQLLVMLRAAPPHFRPDASYADGYDSRVGRDARRRIADGIARQYGLRVVDEWPMPALGVHCFVMEAAGDASVAKVVERLSLDARVESVQSMHLFHVLSHNDPLYPLQPTAALWHLAEIHKITQGRQVRVAEIDTGVEIDHPDLRGGVMLARNFVDDRPDVAEMHGTAVAGIIAARADEGVGIVGVAPESKLLALRACWETPGRGATAICSSFTLAKALQFALDEKAQVINLSLGGPRDALVGRLLDIAMARGVTVVGAADPEVRGGGFPASHRGVLAVAAQDDPDSSAAPLRGPGRDIPTTIVGHKWGFVSGSSFAAAHVSGLVALLRELAPGAPLQQIRDALAPASVSGVANDHRGVVDACAAVTRIGGTCACACAVAGDARLSPPL